MPIERVNSSFDTYGTTANADSTNSNQASNGSGRRQGSRSITHVLNRTQTFPLSVVAYTMPPAVSSSPGVLVQIPITPFSSRPSNLVTSSVNSAALQARAANNYGVTALGVPASSFPVMGFFSTSLPQPLPVLAVTPVASQTGNRWSGLQARGISSSTANINLAAYEGRPVLLLLSNLRQSLRKALGLIDSNALPLSNEIFNGILGIISRTLSQTPEKCRGFNINYQPRPKNTGFNIREHSLSHLLIMSSAQLVSSHPEFYTALALGNLKNTPGFNKYQSTIDQGNVRNHWQLACLYGTHSVIKEVGHWTLEKEGDPASLQAVRDQWWDISEDGYTPVQLMMRSIQETLKPYHGTPDHHPYIAQVEKFCFERFTSLLKVMKNHYVAALKAREPGKPCSNYLDYWAPSRQLMISADGQWNIYQIARAAGGDRFAERIIEAVRQFHTDLDAFAQAYKNKQPLSEGSLSGSTHSSSSESSTNNNVELINSANPAAENVNSVSHPDGLEYLGFTLIDLSEAVSEQSQEEPESNARSVESTLENLEKIDAQLEKLGFS